MKYAEQLTPVERLVTLAIRGQRTDQEAAELARHFEQLGEPAARDAARRNHVEGMVGSGLAEALGPEVLGEGWRTLLDDNRRRVERLIDALAGVVARLEARRVRSAAFEGGGILLGSDVPLEAYGPSDIDLLVESACWSDAVAAFAAEGFVPSDRRGRPTRRTEFRRDLPSGETQWLEAGYAPFDRMWVPVELNHRCDAWLERRVESRKGHGLFVLHPDDSVTCVALHTSLHSYVRAPGIRLHTDVDRAVRDNDVDWDRVIAESGALGTPTRVCLSLAMAASLLGTPVPDDVIRALAPPRWRGETLSELLAAEGVFVRGRPKLPRGRTILLDALLEEEGPASWLRNVLLPDTAWLREHFDRERSQASVLALHVRRARSLLTQWSPR